MIARRPPRAVLLAALALLAGGCGDPPEPPPGTDPAGRVEKAVVDYLERIRGGRPPAALSTSGVLAGGRFAAGLEAFEIGPIEILTMDDEAATARTTIGLTWMEPEGQPVEHAQTIDLTLAADGDYWKVVSVAAAEAPDRTSTTRDHFAHRDPTNPTLDDRTSIPGLRLRPTGLDAAPAGKPLADRLALVLPESLAAAGLEFGLVDDPEAPAVDVIVAFESAEGLLGYPAYGEVRYAVHLTGRVPFAKPRGSWRIDHRWERIGRSIGFADPAAEETILVGEAATDLADRFAAALAGRLAALNAGHGSAVQAAYGPTRERVLADLPAGPPRRLPDGTIVVRTQGQQIQALSTGPDPLWTAGGVLWPKDRTDPLAYPRFTHGPPTVTADGRIVSFATSPDPPHAARLVILDSTGQDLARHPVDGVPTSTVAVTADGRFHFLVRVETDEGDALDLVSLKADGALDAQHPTGWPAPRHEPIELVAGPDGTLTAIAADRIATFQTDASVVARAEADGLEPFRSGGAFDGPRRVHVAGRRLVTHPGGEVVHEAPEGEGLTWVVPGPDRTLYTGGDRVVVALAADGSVRWRVEVDVEVTQPPQVDGPTLHLGGSNRLLALRAADGSVAWSSPVVAKGVHWPPVEIGQGEARRLLVVGVFRSYLDPSGRR